MLVTLRVRLSCHVRPPLQASARAASRSELAAQLELWERGGFAEAWAPERLAAYRLLAGQVGRGEGGGRRGRGSGGPVERDGLEGDFARHSCHSERRNADLLALPWPPPPPLTNPEGRLLSWFWLCMLWRCFGDAVAVILASATVLALSGRLVARQVLDTARLLPLDWRRLLGLQLWYGCGPLASPLAALNTYLLDRHAQPSLVPHPAPYHRVSRNAAETERGRTRGRYGAVWRRFSQVAVCGNRAPTQAHTCRPTVP